MVDPDSELAALSEPVCWGSSRAGKAAASEMSVARSGVEKNSGYWEGEREGGNRRRDSMLNVDRGVKVFLMLSIYLLLFIVNNSTLHCWTLAFP